MHQVERAIFDIRRGLPVVIENGEALSLVHPVEGIRDSGIAELLRQGLSPALVVSRHRLQAMGFSGHNHRSEAVRLPLAPGVGPDAGQLCSKAFHEQPGDDGSFSSPEPAGRADRAALALMRRALLIPSALVANVDVGLRGQVEQGLREGRLLQVQASAAENCFEGCAGLLTRVSEADVPLEGAPEARFILFREPDGLREHVAVAIGAPGDWPDSVPVRLHSSCLTGDLFGSLRCDCGEQLRTGVTNIQAMGGGLLLYLAQEGRGIGLANKLRAYALQDRGHDTVDADQILGFGQDERNYRVAVDMLAALEISRVRLLTNNPEKIRALEAGGIRVDGREALFGRINDHNRRYLSAKATRSGHLLSGMLKAGSKV